MAGSAQPICAAPRTRATLLCGEEESRRTLALKRILGHVAVFTVYCASSACVRQRPDQSRPHQEVDHRQSRHPCRWWGQRRSQGRRHQEPSTNIDVLRLITSITGFFSDTIKTVFFAFGIIYLFWPSDDAYFLVHQSKRYSILFLLRI